ncbi:MAG: sigma-70 family RNA polymerase sigma factor [Planctomycetota bacterium]
MPNVITTFPRTRTATSSRPLLTREQETELGRAWRVDGDRAARDRLITANTGLVIALARRLGGRGVPIEELIAEGQVGLISAVDRFDPNCGCRLSTYATYWIRQSISEAFAKSSSRGQLNRADRAALRTLERAEIQFAATRGCPPTHVELGELLGWRIDRVQAVGAFRSACERQSPADSQLGSVGMTPSSTTADDLQEGNPRERWQHAMGELLSRLSDKERTAVELRFGFEGGVARTVAAVGAAMNLAPPAVRALLSSAVKKLSRMVKESGTFRARRSLAKLA